MKKALVFPGGGIYFYWKMGIMDYIQEHYDCRDVHMIGVSAGALTAVLAVCRVNVHDAMETAFRVMARHNVYERKLYLWGIWKTILVEWLHEILPDNVAWLCQDRVHILVSRVCHWKPMVVSTYGSKDDVVECLAATCHLPFIMDYSPFCTYRGVWCYDGDTMRNDNSYKILGEDCQYYFFRYFHDNNLLAMRTNRVWFQNHTVLRSMIRYGWDHAKKLDENGVLFGLQQKETKTDHRN